MAEDLSSRLAENVRLLREARGLTQQQMAKLCELPRATWSNLESGAANPTLHVLHRVASALQVPIEELISAPRASVKHYPRTALAERKRGDVTVRSLLPDKVPGMVLERMELPPRGRMTGTPHTPGTREYLTCERGTIELVAAATIWKLEPGDVVVFRGDQRHAYANPSAEKAVGYSVVVLQPVVE